MGVLTVCLTCWLVFVRETSGEDPGQVTADTFIMQIMQHVTRYSLGKKHSRLDAHPLHKIWSHNRQNRAGGPGPRQPGQWRGRVFHKVKIMFVPRTHCNHCVPASQASLTPRPRSPAAGSRRRSQCWAGRGSLTPPEPRQAVPGEPRQTTTTHQRPRHLNPYHINSE